MAKTYTDDYRKMRWFLERNRMAIFRLDETATQEEDKYLNLTLESDSDTYQVRMYGSKIAQYFTPDNVLLEEIPEQYHEAIVQKAVGWGYEIPPTQNFQSAMYFHKMYEDTVSRAIKWKRMGRTGGWGKIKEDNWFAK